MTKTRTVAFLTLVVLLVTIGTAYYLYVSERESYFVDRNFRLLALGSNKLSEIVEEHKHHFQYLIISASSENGNEHGTCGKTNPQQECQPSQCSENANRECDFKKTFGGNFKEEFEKLTKKFEGKLISVSICPKATKLAHNRFVDDQPHIRVRLSSKDKDRLRLIYERKYEREREGCICVYEESVQGDLSLSKVIRQLITEQAFSDLVVFDLEMGTVHFQKNTSLYRIDDFRDVVLQRSDSGGFFSFFSDNSETTEIQNNKSGSSTSPPLKDLLQNPTHRQITIGDISYELFTQPVVLPKLTRQKQTHCQQTKESSARLILAGLVKTEKFQSEYRAIPHTWLLGFLFFVLLGLLSLPVFRLGVMDSRERLSPIHVLSLLFSCVAGTALIALFFLDVVWLNNIRHSLDERLKETAEHIKAKFSDELEKNLNLLHAYDHSDVFKDDFRCATQQDEDCPMPRDVCVEEGNRQCGEDPKTDRWVARKKYPYSCDEKHKKEFPYHCHYDPVFWVDQKKNVRITWTTDSEYYLQTSKVSLAHRDYVNRVLDPDVSSSLWPTKDGHLTFFAQSLSSLETGKHTVVFSMESSLPEGKQKKWVAAIETEFQFLKSVAIPDGTGFAVIEDEGGKVLFHSDDNRSLWENFFEETDDNARLKAHVFSRTAGPFQGRYWGKGHAFYSTPLPDVPWSLVVFRNKELFRTINFEALLLASVLFALYTAIPIIVSGAIWLFNKARRRKMSMPWFWPDPDRHDWYYAYIGFIFLLFLGYILWLWFTYTPGEYAVWFPLLYPLVSLIGLWSLTKDYPKYTQEILPKQLHRRYAFAVISFLLLFSALPMGIFFKTGAEREMTLAMKYNLITLGHKLRQTPDLDFSQIQREIRGIDTSGSIAECSEDECEAVKCERTNSQEEDYPLACPKQAVSRTDRTLSTHSIHLSPIATTSLYVSDHEPNPDSCCPPKPSPLETIHKYIRKNSLSRLSNPVSVATLGLIGDQYPGAPFRWRYDPSSSIALDFQVPLKQSDFQTKWGILRSTPPSDLWSVPHFLAERLVLGSFLLIASVLMLIGVPIFIVARMFPILRKSSTNENSKQAKRNSLIVGLHESLNVVCAKNETIDCRQISDPPEWSKITRQVRLTQKAVVRLKHFEYHFGVPRFDRAKLELLAALLNKDKQICVLSTIDPLKFAYDDPATPSSDESKSPVPVSLQTWSQIFQSFSLHYAPVDSRSAPADDLYFTAIWQARTTDEKITLYHLARHGFVHAKNPDLPALLALGLIKSKPAPRWVRHGFEKAVLNAAQRDGLDAKERIKSHPWNWPVAIVLIVLGMGLLLTQKELHNVVVLMLSVLSALLPMLPQLIGSSQRDDNAT